MTKHDLERIQAGVKKNDEADIVRYRSMTSEDKLRILKKLCVGMSKFKRIHKDHGTAR